jgi:uncharacterized protein YeaO (DUF488 family)
MAKLPRALSNRTQASRDQLGLIDSEIKEGTVTLVYGARDQAHNEAVVVKQFLEKKP